MDIFHLLATVNASMNTGVQNYMKLFNNIYLCLRFHLINKNENKVYSFEYSSSKITYAILSTSNRE